MGGRAPAVVTPPTAVAIITVLSPPLHPRVGSPGQPALEPSLPASGLRGLRAHG